MIKKYRYLSTQSIQHIMRTSNKYRVLFCFCIYLTIAIHSVSVLVFRTPYDSDLDVFLLTGREFVDGGLLYRNILEAKLPIIQYIFAAPSKFGGIFTWNILTIVANFVLVTVSINTLGNQNNWIRNFKWDIVGIIYLIIVAIPGQTNHISTVAATTLLLSLTIAVTTNKPLQGVVSGILMAFSCQIRPNYLFVIMPLFILFTCGKRRTQPQLLISAIVGYTFSTLACFLPYMTKIENFGVLLRSVDFLQSAALGQSLRELIVAQSLNPISTPKEFLSFGWFNLVVLIAFVVNFFLIARRVPEILKLHLILSNLSIFLLEISFWKSHYWPHYSVLFLPFLALTLNSYFNILHLKTNSITLKLSFLRMFGLLVILLLATLRNIDNFYELHQSKDVLSIGTKSGNIDDKLLLFLKEEKEKGLSFQVLDATPYALLLDEDVPIFASPALLNAFFSSRKGSVVDTSRLVSYVLNEFSLKNKCSYFEKNMYLWRRQSFALDRSSIKIIKGCLKDNQFESVDMNSGLESYELFRRIPMELVPKT